MFNPAFAAASSLLLFLAVPGETTPERETVLDWQQVTQQQLPNLVIHVPRMTVTRATIVTRSVPAPPPPRAASAMMVEGKTKDCVKMEAIRGFSVSRPDSIDLMLTDGKYMRVKLGKNCPALGFYSGFYVKSHPDKKMCAKRDAVRSRSGRLCAVDGLNTLVPAE
jgi:hypothetical protein